MTHSLGDFLILDSNLVNIVGDHIVISLVIVALPLALGCKDFLSFPVLHPPHQDPPQTFHLSLALLFLE